MAQRRPAVALFEVIHKDKRFAKPHPGSLNTPAWVFKGDHRPDMTPPDDSAAIAVVDPPPKSTLTLRPTPPSASTLLGVPPAARSSDVAAAPAHPPATEGDLDFDQAGGPPHPRLSRSSWAPSTITSLLRHDPLQAQPFDLGEEPPAVPQLPSPADHVHSPEKADTDPVAAAAQPPHAGDPSDAATASVGTDSASYYEKRGSTPRDAAESEADWPAMPASPHFAPLDSGPRGGRAPGSLTWTSGTIIATSAAAVLCVGMFLTRPPHRAAAASRPASTTPPPVLDVGPGITAVNPQAVVPSQQQAPTPIAVTPPTPGIDAEVPAAVTRERGSYYALIQWYRDERTARAAAALLNRSGVPCTVEAHVRGVPSNFAVVGTQAFAHRRATQNTVYLKSVEAISATFSKNPKSLRAFRPQFILWEQGPAPTPTPTNNDPGNG